MSSPQMHGQRLRPVQETGNEKAEPLFSIQQTSVDNSMDVMIDSSGLVMDNGNSPVGFIEDIFTRLTRRLVFEFLGGHARMEELPCLGDLTNRNYGIYRTFPIPMEPYSESSQIKFLDPISLDTFDSPSTACSPSEHTSQRTDEIELLPENSIKAHLICNKFVKDILNLDNPTTNLLFQQCDFTGKFVLSTIDAGSNYDSQDSNTVPATVFENLTQKIQKISENQKTEIQEDALTNHHHALTSENFESQFHLHHKNLEEFPVSSNFSTPAWNNEPIYNGNTFSIPNPGTLMDYLYGDLEIPQFRDAESSSMQSEDSCYIIGNNGKGPTFSVPGPSQLMNFLYGDLESPVFLSPESTEEVVHSISNYADRYSDRSSERKLISQSADHTIEESHQCSSMSGMVTSETIAGLMTKSLCDADGFTNGMDLKRVRISSSSKNDEENSEVSDSKLSYHRDVFNVADHSKKCISEVHNTPATEPERPSPKKPTTFVPTTIPLLYKCKDGKESMKTDPSPFTFNTAVPSLMNENSASNYCENSEIYASSPCCDQKVCLLGDYGSDDDVEVEDLSDCALNDLFSNAITYNILNLPIESKNRLLAGAFEENKITPTSTVSVGCKGGRISSNSSLFDLSDHDDHLKYYGLSNQEQYTDTGYSCESPTWLGKSEGHLQNSPNYLTSNLTEDENTDGILTADYSHSNTDEMHVMNKNRTDEIYERKSENSVSPCYLNRMEPALNTDDADSMDCLPLLHSCSDGFEDSTKHQYLKNDENAPKFAFPDSSTLKDYFFGSLDSPKFLASELLDGKVDNLHYQSIFGYCEQSDRTEEADLPDKMIFDQFCQDLSRDDNSINKFSCSTQLLDLISSPFDISNHDKLLERYGINDQDQFMGDD